MKGIQKIVNGIAKVLSTVSFVGVVVGVLFVVVDVVLRYFFSSPIAGDYDYTQIWLSVIVMSALPYVQTHHGHVNVTMGIKLFKPQLAVGIFAVATLVGAVISAICCYSSYCLAMTSFKRNYVSMMAYVPYGPFEIFESVCMGLLALVMVVDAIMYFMACKDKDECKSIVDSWA